MLLYAPVFYLSLMTSIKSHIWYPFPNMDESLKLLNTYHSWLRSFWLWFVVEEYGDRKEEYLSWNNWAKVRWEERGKWALKGQCKKTNIQDWLDTALCQQKSRWRLQRRNSSQLDPRGPGATAHTAAHMAALKGRNHRTASKESSQTAQKRSADRSIDRSGVSRSIECF